MTTPIPALLLVAAAACASVAAFSAPPIPITHSAVRSPTRPPFLHGLAGSAADDAVAAENADSDPTAALRRDAERLRREAGEMEEQMKERRKERSDAAAAAASSAAASKDGGGADDPSSSSLPGTYTALPGSAWTVSYRFSSDPPPKDDDDDRNDGEKKARDTPKPRFYSGKVDVLLRDDGYTTILNSDRVSGGIAYTKFWGWDEELSQLDNERYLCFSADVTLPPDDPYIVNTNAESERVYFNARVEKNLRTGEVALGDGKVTVKRDLEPPGGFWGLFSGQGIMAQFRYCGDFVCRPIAMATDGEEER